MKFFFLFAASLLASGAFAQEAAKARPKPVWPSQNLQIKSVAENIRRASVRPIKQPQMVQIDLATEMKKIKDHCPYLMAQKATLNLQGKRANNALVQLDWETTNGWNNDRFFLERSLGDSLHFEQVSAVWARQVAGLRDAYHQPDENAYSQVSYYRVKLLLRNGGFLTSNIAPVKGWSGTGLTVFPNPVSNLATLNMMSTVPGGASIKVIDAAGKIVQLQNTLVVAGNNSRQLALSHLAAGWYTVAVLFPDKTEGVVQLAKK